MTNTHQTQITEHMAEPWTYNHMAIIQDAQGNIIADCAIVPECEGFTPTQEQEVANARRLCAAVNASRGISTEALEQAVVRQLVEALEDLYNWLTPDWQQSSLGEKARAAIAKARAASPFPEQATADRPIVAVSVRDEVIDVEATIPVTVVVEDWDVPDEDTGKKPARNVYGLAGKLSGPKAEKLRRLIAND
jgi:hypothetical protein